jgi:glycosyl-4,4'-diaponeurosporenoate acyltransferase
MNSLVVNAVAWLVAGSVVGFVFARRDWNKFHALGPFTRIQRFESRLFYERVLRVRKWKHFLPEAGTWFGGISKRKLPSVEEGGRRRLLAESLRAERVHWTLLTLIPISIGWNAGWWIAFNTAIGIAINVPCIAVARYNRIRLSLLT